MFSIRKEKKRKKASIGIICDNLNEDDKIAKSSNFAVGNMMIKKITWIKVVYVVYLYLSNIYHIFLSPADNGTLVAIEEGWVGTTSASQGR